MSDSFSSQTSNLSELVETLFEDRDNHDDGWFREQLSEMSNERQEQAECLFAVALDDVETSGNVNVTTTRGRRTREYDAEWPVGFDGWSGKSKPERVDAENGFMRRFTWRFRGKLRTWEMEVPGPLFKYYTERYRTRNFGTYIADPFDRPFISSLANRIRAFSDENGLAQRDRINTAIRFVQSLEYTPDDVTTGQSEYPKYPVETLVHDGGDCEDTSILLGAILRELGCDVAPIVLPNHHHMILGVSPTIDVDGTYYEDEGTRYYTVEATGHGWDLGELPPQYKNASAQIYPIGTDPILVHEWHARPRETGTVEITVDVANFGDATADKLGVYVEFEDTNASILARERLARNCQIRPSLTESFQSTITLPDDRRIRGRCILRLHHQLHDESTSDWQDPPDEN